LALRPSYIAYGPVYATTTKDMPWAPPGPAGLAHWRRIVDRPLVAIGGLTRQRAPLARAAGADSIAVITAVTHAADPIAETRAWLEFFDQSVDRDLWRAECERLGLAPSNHPIGPARRPDSTS
jgi:thiamine monophosphate synthase